MTFGPKRSRLAPVLVALLVLLAGCSGFMDSGADSSPTEATPEDPSPSESTDETTPDDATGDDGATTDDNETSDNESAEMSGQLLVVIEGQDTHFAGAADDDSSFWINESNEHTWHADSTSMTLSQALEAIDLEASADSLTHDGTTYSDGENDTNVTYRVDGENVEELDDHELESDDLVAVYVDTGSSETPGRYVSDAHPHPHGSLEISVDGEQLNMTGEEHTMADRYFHFHGDEGAERWHGHSMNITVAYAISTFPDMNLTDDSFTHDGTTYDLDDETVNVTVNGEPVDPESHVLKDGDDLRIEVSEE